METQSKNAFLPAGARLFDMERHDYKNNCMSEFPDVDLFIEEVVSVCKKHGFTIGHEDGHGGFIIHKSCPHDFEMFDWFRDASYNNPKEELFPKGT